MKLLMSMGNGHFAISAISGGLLVTYKAAVISGNLRNGLKDYLPQMNEISKQNVDIVLLASEVSDSETYGKADCTDNYDELIRDISLLANRFNIYVVTHLYQKVQCQGNVEAMKNNIVFDRKGAIVAVYTKPLNNYATCNVTSQNTFTTDFGVEFLVLMEEDLLLQDLESLRNTKNVIITGRAADNMVYIKGNQLIASLAYISDVNVLSDDGIFIGKAGLKSKGGVLEINKNGKGMILYFISILIRDISLLANRFNIYVVTHLYQKVQCQGNVEAMKNNIVFDRKGAIVAVYTKPLNNYATCNVTSQNTFTTDFGVEFLVLMEEDLLLQDLESLRNTKNVIITGRAADNMVYIKGNQLISSLAYISDVNVLSDDGIFIGKAGLKSKGGVLEINKHGKGAKTTEAHYGLSVYSGVRRMGEHYIGVDSCKLVVCAALYKRTCVLGLENSMDMGIIFEKISIKGNFTAHHSTQFPVILTTQTSMSSDSFSFVKKLTKDIQEVSTELSNAKNILKFGILSRDFTRDYDDANFNSNSSGQNETNICI
ncbi:hypothetical protein RR46_04586 [Papilio xuthus]|uniref:Vanin C-terminal domain-containing protein n=1 Tax=Papilio xuthus TaxID=66420 RepID=A0A194PZZ8_PAPXU|nr:hypothetical protein RR46_04586 [Papilio xuthus]